MKANNYLYRFIPYAAAAFLVGLIGGFTTLLGPAFVQDIGIAYNNTTWTALSLAISSAACAPILGRLGDIWGRRYTLLLGIGIFTLGNILTALATDLFFMLVARFIVGLGTAALTPVILSFIIAEFPSAAMTKGFSIYMLVSSSAVIFGPSIGGILVNNWGWRVMVWVCVALCIAVWLFCLLTDKKTSFTPKSLAGFDWLGAIMVLIFFGLALCVPSFWQNFGLNSPAFIAIAISAVIALAVLLYAEKQAQHPILQSSFIARKAFILPIIVLFLTQGLMQANMTNTIVFVNYTQPGNTMISGYAISIMYLGMSLGAVLAGSMANKHEPKNILTFTLFLTAAGCALMLFFTTDTSVLLLGAALGILGFGLGGNATVFLKIVFAGVDAKQAGSGTGIYGLFRDLAAPFGVAIFVPLFTNGITKRISTNTNWMEATAAVASIRSLAIAELACVAAAIIIVRLLPKVHNRSSEQKIS